PKIPVTDLKGTGLKDVNIEAEKRLEAALEAEDQNAPAGARAAAWCALAEIAVRNPYLLKARGACTQWRDYEAALEKQKQMMEGEYRTLVGFLALKRRTADEKLSAVDGFLKTFAALKDTERYRSAQTFQKQLTEKQPLVLPDLGSEPVVSPAPGATDA